MIAFMTWTAELGRLQQGEPVRKHLEAAAVRGVASAKAQLVPPPLPEPLVYLWETWLDLHAARPEGQHGIAPLTYGELSAYCTLTGDALTPWEVSVLLTMDRTYRQTITEPA